MRQLIKVTAYTTLSLSLSIASTTVSANKLSIPAKDDIYFSNLSIDIEKVSSQSTTEVFQTCYNGSGESTADYIRSDYKKKLVGTVANYNKSYQLAKVTLTVDDHAREFILPYKDKENFEITLSTDYEKIIQSITGRGTCYSSEFDDKDAYDRQFWLGSEFAKKTLGKSKIKISVEKLK